jgi:hypothetical protein
MNGSTTTTWRLVSLSPLPAWALAALTVLVLAGVVLAVLGLRREPSTQRRRLLLMLRLMAGAMALFFLLEPGLRQLAQVRVKNRMAVLVDRSASMGFPVRPEGQSRAAAAAEALDRFAPGLENLRDRYQVEVLGFTPELGPVSSEALRTAGPANRTDLMGALRALKATDTGGSRKLAGAVLLSDGADNAELQGGLQGRQADELGAFGFPVSTIRVGEPALVDLAVEAVKVDDFAFVRNAVTVDLELHARGLKGRDVPVVLQREGLTLGTRTVHLDQDDQRAPLSFTFTPDQTGRFVYTVGAPVFPGEAVTENNTRSFVLKIIRDRVRVLLVVGRPSWDERFLRGLLRQDPNVDLVSFYILRTSSDDTQTRNPERELSLIPFPMEEIFDTKLHTFDVVVFQNFGYAEPALSIASYERNLEQYVSGGGALLVIGGDHAFGEGRAAYPIPRPGAAGRPQRGAGRRRALQGEAHRGRAAPPGDAGPDRGERNPVLVGRAAAGQRAERRAAEAGCDGAARASQPPGSRPAGAGPGPVGSRPRAGDGADDRRQLDLGLHRPAHR